MSMEILQQQVQGLEATLQDLRDKERLLTKAQGLDEQAEKSAQQAQEKAKEVKDLKQELYELKNNKASAVAATSYALATKMQEVLPYGAPFLQIDQGKVTLHWERDGKKTPHAGLSGGEQVAFEAALTHALCNGGDKVLVMEAAELDDEHLAQLLDRAKDVSGQVIVNTCHEPSSLPEGWEITRLGGEQ
jgi:seryl-tRNA synthetase